jgi:hypothetical protein
MGDTTYYASSADVNLVRNVFVPSYTFNGSSGQFEVQLDTNLRGNVFIGDASTNYLFRVNGGIVQAELPTGTYNGDYIYWNGFSYVVGSSNVTLGAQAGEASSVGQSNSVAIGVRAGSNSQMDNNIAIGTEAGALTQSPRAVAIGINAGHDYQGSNSIAIGAYAGVSSQIANSIILNATGVSLNATNSGLYIAPIRPTVTLSSLYYNPTTKEITYGTTPSSGGTTLPNGTDFGDYLYWNTSAYVVGDVNITLGSFAGSISQGNYAIAMGRSAGTSNQGTNAVAIGLGAAESSQGADAVAIGWGAAQFGQGADAVAIGSEAALILQGSNAVAIGREAGKIRQGTNAVAMGYYAGNVSQGGSAVAIGHYAGNVSQGGNAVAIGHYAGNVSQGGSAVAIGPYAGCNYQAANSIILNASTNSLDASTRGFFVEPVRSNIGAYSIYYNNTTKEITYGTTPSGSGTLPPGSFYGDYLYWNNTAYAVGGSNITLGSYAGSISQGQYATAIGFQAGSNNQQSNAIAIGAVAGSSNQRQSAIAIGVQAGRYDQRDYAIAIGSQAGYNDQGQSAIAIGQGAGYGLSASQGAWSIAIGNDAGYNSQAANSIILNASANPLNSSTLGFFVEPVRSNIGAYSIYYNNTTKEITYGTTPSGGGGTILPSGTYTGDYLYWSNGAYQSGSAKITLGANAGATGQGANGVAIGENAGTTNQSMGAVAIGLNAGSTSQGAGSVAIGNGSGSNRQGVGSVAIGSGTASSDQGSYSVAIGFLTSTSQGAGAVMIGRGYEDGGQAYIGANQGQDAIAIGTLAGKSSQKTLGIAIGRLAGHADQSMGAVAIGYYAGNTNQGSKAVAIGYNVGSNGQAPSSIAIGDNAQNSGTYSTAIGTNIGVTGIQSTAIGANAYASHNNTIVLNAQGYNLSSAQSDSLFVAPIRSDVTTSGLYNLTYNRVTREVITTDYAGPTSVFLRTTQAFTLGNATPGQFSTPTFTIATTKRNPYVYLNDSLQAVFGVAGNYQITIWTTNVGWGGGTPVGSGAVSFKFAYFLNTLFQKEGPLVLTGVQNNVANGAVQPTVPEFLNVPTPGSTFQLSSAPQPASSNGGYNMILPTNTVITITYLGT